MTPALAFREVSKQYRARSGRVVDALQGVSFEVSQGDFFALLGPNGAGKTTLIQCMAGLVRPTHGSVAVMGHDVTREPYLARRLIGVVPQELVFDPFFTVRETLRMQSGFFGLGTNDPWIDECLEALGLTEKADANMRALSGGMKRRVLVAQAIVHRPAVIVLDEPTAGVDIQLRESLWSFMTQLNQQGHTIVLTTHYLEEAESLCRNVAFLKQGRLVAHSDTQTLLAGGSMESTFKRLLQNAPVE